MTNRIGLSGTTPLERTGHDHHQPRRRSAGEISRSTSIRTCAIVSCHWARIATKHAQGTAGIRSPDSASAAAYAARENAGADDPSAGTEEVVISSRLQAVASLEHCRAKRLFAHRDDLFPVPRILWGHPTAPDLNQGNKRGRHAQLFRKLIARHLHRFPVGSQGMFCHHVTQGNTKLYRVTTGIPRSSLVT